MTTITTGFPAKVHARKLAAELKRAFPGKKVRYVEPHTITSADGKSYTQYPQSVVAEDVAEAEVLAVLAQHVTQKTEDEELQEQFDAEFVARLKRCKPFQKLLARMKALDGQDE